MVRRASTGDAAPARGHTNAADDNCDSESYEPI
jgi:hypothetical protein